MVDKNHEQESEEIIYVSRAELKRDAKEFHQLGEEMAKLSKKQRATIPLSDELQAAMTLADKLAPKKEAYRRHLNYIAKCLRLCSNIDDINKAMNVIKNKHQLGNVLLHKLEHIRDEILNQGDARINLLIEQYGEFDRQKLRQLMRQARKEQAQEKPAKGYRELFQYLKEVIHE